MLIAIKAPKMSTRARNHNPKLTQLRIIAMVFATESFHNGWREREREREEREREERGERRMRNPKKDFTPMQPHSQVREESAKPNEGFHDQHQSN